MFLNRARTTPLSHICVRERLTSTVQEQARVSVRGGAVHLQSQTTKAVKCTRIQCFGACGGERSTGHAAEQVVQQQALRLPRARPAPRHEPLRRAPVLVRGVAPQPALARERRRREREPLARDAVAERVLFS